ncbi:MAG: META domain-containing protein [Idiomarina sp.]|nr:META domain-containing protein [Idiomarina sp.]
MAQLTLPRCILSATAVAVLAACSSADEPSEVTYYCGAQQITVMTPDEGQLRLNYAGQQHDLRTIESASGARYVNDDEEFQVSFWSRGERGRLEVNGQDFPECRQAGAIVEPFTAQGNEPFWQVSIENDEAVLRNMGEDDVSYSIASHTLEDQRSAIENDDGSFRMTVTESLCQDNMSGMYYPQTVTLELGDDTLHGCGGRSESLLQGVDWKVVELDDHDYRDEEVTIRFTHSDSDEPQVVGLAACNRYFGQYELGGESLHISQLAGTKMACEDETMRIEYEFLNALSESRGFSVEREDGEPAVVFLHTSEGRLRLEQAQ